MTDPTTLVARLREAHDTHQTVYEDDRRRKALFSEAADTLEALQAIVDRLPKTHDGVPVVPGVDPIWKWWHMDHGAHELICETAPSAKHLVAVCYSTEQAGRNHGTPTDRKLKAARNTKEA